MRETNPISRLKISSITSQLKGENANENPMRGKNRKEIKVGDMDSILTRTGVLVCFVSRVDDVGEIAVELLRFFLHESAFGDYCCVDIKLATGSTRVKRTATYPQKPVRR